MSKLLSVVVPVYFEEEVVEEFYRRMKAVLVGLSPRMDHELIFVNDGSEDRTLDILKELSSKDPNLKILSLSRNFGHQIAITCGTNYAKGDAVVVIDADLQDPPEVIAEMVDKWEEGYEVVYGVRSKREGESFFKLVTANAYYRIINALSDTPLPLDSGDFRLMDRAVVDALGDIQEENRYIRGLVSWVGFNQYPLEYKRDSRYAGETKYTLKKMLRFAFDGIVSFSDKPLRVSSKFGFLVTFLSALFALRLIIAKLLNPAGSVQGWTTILVMVLFLGGIQLMAIGVLGEYVGRIYTETKRRPLYIVGWKHGFGEKK